MTHFTLPPRVRRLRVPILVTLVLSFFVLLLAWAADPSALLPNLFVELASIGVTIVVGFVVVDTYVEHLRRQQWSKPRNYALGAIAAHLCDLASDLHVHFGIGGQAIAAILAGRYGPSPEVLPAFGQLMQELFELPDQMDGDKSTSDVAVDFYRDVKWDLDQIQNVLTPWLMQMAPDEEVINALTQFDAARRVLDNLIIQHDRVVTHQVMPGIFNLLMASGILYDIISHHWNPLDFR